MRYSLHKKRHTLSSIFLLSLLVGCASQTPKPDKDVYGPQSKEEGQTLDIAIQRLPKKKICLSLGGAGVASFATIGLLKQFEQSGLKVSAIVVTGWPSLFAIGYGFFKSVHDLEWFGVRLERSDFFGKKLIDFNKGFSDHEDLKRLLDKTFTQSNLNQSKIPLVLSSTQSSQLTDKSYRSGDWKEPLLQSMSVPGLFRPFQDQNGEEWVSLPSGMNLKTCEELGGEINIAIEMYGDYFISMTRKKSESREELFQKIYLSEQKASLETELNQANLRGQIYLKRGVTDFSAKRAAILAGQREAQRILRLLKSREE